MVPTPCIGPQNDAVAERSGTRNFPFPALVGLHLESLFWDLCFRGAMEQWDGSS